jgi:hypothetical protein
MLRLKRLKGAHQGHRVLGRQIKFDRLPPPTKRQVESKSGFSGINLDPCWLSQLHGLSE